MSCKTWFSTLFAVALGTLSTAFAAGDGMSLYPNGENFLFAGYSPSANMYLKLKSDGFTAVGPRYGAMQKTMPSVRKSGLPVIYSIKGPYSKRYLRGREPIDPAKLEAAVIAEVKAAVAAYSSDIYCWYLCPEELRFWRKREYLYLQILSAAIRKADPLKRPVWMYNPGHYNANGLQKYLPHLTMIGKGTYTGYSGFKNQRVWVRHSILQQLEAVEKSGSKAPVLAVLEMFRPVPEAERDQIAKWVRHDVYCSLISGAKGIVIFSLWPRKNFRNAGHREYYSAYRECALELTGKELDLGKVFLAGRELKNISLKITGGPAEEKLIVHKVNYSYPTVNFKALEYKGKRYLFVVNSSAAAVSCQISGLPGTAAVREIKGSRVFRAEKSGAVALQLAPLEVLLLNF